MTAREELLPEHDIFIQQMKLKNTLREWMGENAVTHSGGLSLVGRQHRAQRRAGK